jgi:predicted Zn-dependent protease
MDTTRFEDLATAVRDSLPAGFGFTLDASGEDSDFVRFNHARVRQPGSVSQGTASLRLVQGQRHATFDVPLSGDPEVDRARIGIAVGDLASTVPSLPEDPHLLLASEVTNTEHVDDIATPDPEGVIDTVCGAAEGTDFVGIYAGGTVWRGFANHHGQRNWFESGGTLLDYTLVHDADKGVKGTVGGKTWSAEAVARSIETARRQLAPLALPSRTVKPGSYRVYLTPEAVGELIELMAMDGFSERAHRTKSSALHRLVAGTVCLDPRVTLTEDTAGGMGPNFQGAGFVKPAVIPLVVEGKHRGSIVSPRSAAEYNIATNGGSGWEQPSSLSMGGGDLATEDALKRLGTGVWVSNLWYLNWSDPNAARATGMTRFATFWVENGEIVAPLSVMRFDASYFDIFGEALEALTREVAFLPSSSTYGQRSTDSLRVPGALVSAFPFTL